MNLGIIYALIAMVSYGLSNGVAKVPTEALGNQRTIFFRGVFISIMLFLFLVFSEFALSSTYILVAFGISVIGYVSLSTFYKSLEVGKVGIVSPIANSSVIFTILFSVIFFKESLSRIQLGAVFLILIGIVLISVDFRDFRHSDLFSGGSGVPFALLTCLLWGLFFFLLKIPVNFLGPVLTSFISEFGVFVLSFFRMKFSRLSFSFPKKAGWHLFFVALFGASGLIFFTSAFEFADVSVVAAVTFANPLVATLYGKFAYGEKLSLVQYFAGLVIVAGIVLVSLFAGA